MIELHGKLSDINSDSVDPDYGDPELFHPGIVDKVFSRLEYTVIVAVSPMILLLAASLIFDIAKLAFSSQPVPFNRTFTFEVLTSWIVWIFVFWLLVDFLTVARWRLNTPKTFTWLLESGVLKARSGDLEKEYQDFYNNYRQELDSHEGRARIMTFTMAFWFVAIMVVRRVSILEESSNLLLLTFVFFLSLLPLIYCSGSTAWTSYVIGKYIRRLTERFDIVIRPRHPDKCGGLKPLGDYCFDMTLPIVVYMLVFLSIGIGCTLFLQNEKEVTILAYSGLFLLGIPILTASFLLPLSTVHEYMVQSRREEEDNFANKMSQLELIIDQSFNRPGELDKVKDTKAELDLIQVLNPNVAGYPTWPFPMSVIAKVYSPQILALVGVVISVVDLIIHR